MNNTNKYQRAFFAWDVLARFVKSTKKTITYSDLASQIGIHHRVVNHALGAIQDYCIASGLPPFTVVVVNKNVGRPGDGFVAHDSEDFENGLAMVAAYDWQALPNPFAFAADGVSNLEDLAKTLASDPDSSVDIFRLVKDRGICQILFRKALRRAYGDVCAFTGICYDDDGLLEACHIVPWAQATPAERLDVRNGILLNPLHHKLFDLRYLTIDENYLIHYQDAMQKKWSHNAMETLLTVDLHGKKMHLPENTSCAPGARYIERHNKGIDWI